jgi:DNA-binding MarR family transcriptional regulator
MNIVAASAALMRLYPRIYFACHRRHVRDPRTRAVLSAHQASILDHLDVVEPTLVKDLAAHLGVTPSTMSLALDRLEAAGYVRRKRDLADARRVGVRLTAAGVRIREANSVLDPDLVHALLQRLAPPDRERAIAGLALLAEAASGLDRDARERSSGED